VPNVSPALLVKFVVFVDIQDLAICFAIGLHLVLKRSPKLSDLRIPTV